MKRNLWGFNLDSDRRVRGSSWGIAYMDELRLLGWRFKIYNLWHYFAFNSWHSLTFNPLYFVAFNLIHYDTPLHSIFDIPFMIFPWHSLYDFMTFTMILLCIHFWYSLYDIPWHSLWHYLTFPLWLYDIPFMKFLDIHFMESKLWYSLKVKLTFLEGEIDISWDLTCWDLKIKRGEKSGGEMNKKRMILKLKKNWMDWRKGKGLESWRTKRISGG